MLLCTHSIEGARVVNPSRVCSIVNTTISRSDVACEAKVGAPMDRHLERQAQVDRSVVELWHQRRPEQRREGDVLIFYGWLVDYEPSLIPDEPGSYRKLRRLLLDHLVDA